MKQYRPFFVFVALMLLVSLACYGGTPPTNTPVPTNTPAPTSAPSLPQPPQPPQPPSNPSGNSASSSGSSDLVTFTDQNNLLAFDLPGNWKHENTQAKDNTYYVDTFTAPDESAKIESLVYDDGTVYDSRAALYFLNNFYSATGKEGDIRISTDQIMKDGSERFEWTSKSGGYSGVSFFEWRGNSKTTFLLFTAWWSDNADQATLDVINNAIGSYNIP